MLGSISGPLFQEAATSTWCLAGNEGMASYSEPYIESSSSRSAHDSFPFPPSMRETGIRLPH